MEKAAFQYVEAYLTDRGMDCAHRRAGQSFRSRAAHIARVMMWLERLMAQGGAEHPDALLLAAAFHDIGYAVNPENHAAESAALLRAYGAERGLPPPLVEIAAFYVAEHSNKERWMPDPSAPRDLILLMEADLLDEEGAMGLALDCLTAGALGGGYDEALAQMRRYEPRRLARNPMATPLAIKFWEDKQAVIASFLSALLFDMGETDGQ